METAELRTRLNAATSIEELKDIAKAMGDNNSDPNIRKKERIFVAQARPILSQASAASAISLAKAFLTWSGHHGVLGAFVQEKNPQSMTEAILLVEAIEKEQFGSLEAFETILETSLTLIANASLEELAVIAKKIVDPSNTGADSQWAETVVINSALPKIKTCYELAGFAEEFNVQTGRHRLIKAYVEENGISTEREAIKLLKLVKGDKFGGQEAKAAIAVAAKTAGIKIDHSLLKDENCPCPICRSREGAPKAEDPTKSVEGKLIRMLATMALLSALEEKMVNGEGIINGDISTASQLDQILAIAHQNGKLKNVIFGGPFGEKLTIREFMESAHRRQQLPPDMAAVMEKYAAMMA